MEIVKIITLKLSPLPICPHFFTRQSFNKYIDHLFLGAAFEKETRRQIKWLEKMR
jgi:hypothetical protein